VAREGLPGSTVSRRMPAQEENRMRPNERIRVLIAHGDPLISAGLAATLGRLRDFETASGDGRLPAADVVVADYESGLRVIASGGALGRRVLILTYSDSEAKICHALEQGARGYLLLGCSLKDLIDGLRSVSMGGIALGPLVASRIADRMKQQALTPREADILRYMMLGMSNKAIASKLTLAVGTVKTHVKSVLEKLDATSRTQAVSIAQRRGILRDEAEPPVLPLRALPGIGWPLHEPVHELMS
jgi:DNA-binding NarL/FixJ family response regulator